MKKILETLLIKAGVLGLPLHHASYLFRLVPWRQALSWLIDKVSSITRRGNTFVLMTINGTFYPKLAFLNGY